VESAFIDTGMGMAIVRNLGGKTLGGRITVSSTLGEGTRVDMVLPCVLPGSHVVWSL
jgi:signal transduction histidine kinase